MALPFVTDVNSDALFKKTYASTMKSMLYGSNKRFLLGAIKKTVGGGESFTVPIEFGGQPGRSATFANALANRGLSQRRKFVLDWTENHVQALVRNTDIELSKNAGASAVVALKMAEIKSSTETLANSVEHALIRSGFNEIGQIATGGVAGQVVTMAFRADCNIVDLNQVLVAAASISAGALRAGVGVVSNVDRDAGVITLTGALTGWVAGDYLFQQGDQLGSATPLNCIGIGGWIPIVAPSGADVGAVDRSVAPQALAGVRVDGRGKSAKEAIFDLVTRVADAGGTPDVILATNDFVGKLVKEIEGTTVYAKTPAMDADGEVGIFYESVMLHGPSGQLKVQGSPFMYSDRIFALTMDAWEMRVAGGNSSDPIYNNTYCSTSSPMIDDPATDSQIMRLKALFLLVCNAPQHNGVSQIA
jgi:hypothetical protein